jgi:hypothetical protein
MNVYAWLSLAASVASAVLGLAVYFISSKKLVNRLFVLTCLAGFYWTFTEFMMWQSSTVESAEFWSKTGFLWPFFVVFALHFTLAYTQSGWLKHKVTCLALYLPAFVFAFADLATGLINGPVELEFWGYEDTSPQTWVYGASTFWVSLLPVLALAVCLVFYLRSKDQTKKWQSKFITLGLAVPIVTYLVTNVVSDSSVRR